MTMKHSFILAVLLSMFSLSVSAHERELFDFGWRFTLDNPAQAEAVDHDDSKWRQVDLPHDWSIEGAPDRNNAMGNDGGYYPDGIGWYRKTFTMPASTDGRKVWLYFEGVYERSEIYVNGQRVGGRPYGYSPFYCDVTTVVKPGQKNVVAVKADNSHQRNCRWYTGSGIYRHVWLITSDKIHIDNQGIFITTPTTEKVNVRASLMNESGIDSRVTMRVNIPGIGEKSITTDLPATSAALPATSTDLPATAATTDIDLSFRVNNARLWSPEEPNLYTATITIERDGRVIDSREQTFGIRTFSYSADEGFTLNGKKIELNGACVHHDNGMLGARGLDRADEWRVELLKKGGFNAVRTSHNLSTEAFLDACDRLGLIVIDEAFDNWREKKNDEDYHKHFDRWWKQDVQAMVLRDRNHPSILIWSTGNEVIERKKIEIVTTARRLAAAVKEIDPTRPVTSALCAWDSDWEIYDPLAEAHDIVGYNYMIHKHATDHQRDPERIIIQTESYPRDAFRNWDLLTHHNYIVGDFVWTGLDYLGESGIGRWWYDEDTHGEHYQRPLFPWHGAYCGDIDITGWRKPISHYRDMLHNGTKKLKDKNTETLYVAVREPNGYAGRGNIHTGLWAVWPTWESWNWPGHEGKDIEVEVLSLHESVRLYLNGRLIGEKATTRAEQHKAIFTLPYAEGELLVEAIDGGEVVETRSLATAGEPYALRATADRTLIDADGQDLSFIVIEVVDRQGRVVPNATNLLQLRLTGRATLEAAGSADMTDTSSYITTTPRVWKGRAMAIIKSQRKAGSAVLKISSNGLKSTSVKVKTK